MSWKQTKSSDYSTALACIPAELKGVQSLYHLTKLKSKNKTEIKWNMK